MRARKLNLLLLRVTQTHNKARAAAAQKMLSLLISHARTEAYISFFR